MSRRIRAAGGSGRQAALPAVSVIGCRSHLRRLAGKQARQHANNPAPLVLQRAAAHSSGPQID